MKPETRVCTVCKQEKSIDEFPFNMATYVGDGVKKKYIKHSCNQCRSRIAKDRSSLQKIHGKTKPLGTACQCCGRTDLRLSLDHCHETGQFRGWLCQRCNVSIGALGDNVDGLMNAVLYLQKAYET